MQELEVDARDATRLILQFLKENQLFDTMRALQEEAQISLNAVDSVEAFESDILNGRWDKVLQQTRALECSPKAMMELYELIVLEMIEARDTDVAVQLLRGSAPLTHMKQTQLERYRRLETLTQRAIFDVNEAYTGVSKQKRRSDVAQLLKNEVSTVAPSRLLTLLGQALKWQQLQVIGTGLMHVSPMLRY